jgi:glucokinase
MNQNIAIGADIGGSHISAAAVDLTSGNVLRETLTEKAVNNQAQASEIIAVWASCLAGVLKKVPADRVKGIGFAMPGPFDYVKGICYIKGVSKYENLYGFNIADAIISILKVSDDFKVRFINDASAFAVGEAWGGKASLVRRSMSITIGTGLGSAFISDKIPIVDGEEVPRIGCIYHLPYKDSIADDYFSTRWFIGSYKKITGKEIKGVKEMADMAVTDKIAMELFNDFGKRLGHFLAPWLIKFRAEILVVGGNISSAYHLFGDVFEQTLLEEKSTTEVALSELKENAALLGSAYLFNDKFWEAVQPALPLM